MLRGERGYEGEFSAKRLLGMHSVMKVVHKPTVLVSSSEDASTCDLSTMFIMFIIT
jgi:hypothetical protein